MLLKLAGPFSANTLRLRCLSHVVFGHGESQEPVGARTYWIWDAKSKDFFVAIN